MLEWDPGICISIDSSLGDSVCKSYFMEDRSGIRRSWMTFDSPVQEGGGDGHKEGQPDSPEGLDSSASRV